MKRLIALLIVTSTALIPATAGVRVTAAALAADAPNVILIVTDDQRLAGAMVGMPDTLTLFDQGGTELTRPYSATPLCCPGRGSIRSGRYAHNHGVKTNDSRPDQLLYDQTKTIESNLQDAGYATGIVGKYWNTWPLSSNPPNYDRWATMTGGYNNVSFNVNGTIRSNTGYYTSALTTYSDQFLTGFEANDAQPWYLYITPQAPHSPTTPETQYANALVADIGVSPAVAETDRSDKPPYLRNNGGHVWTSAEVNNRAKPQIRTLMSVDDMVAALFARLEALGETNTIAIYTSDNGYMWGEHGTDAKRWPYIDSVQVPILMRWPGHIAAGVDDPKLVSQVDIAPTIFEATGITPSYQPDGVSMLSSGARDELYLEYFRSPDGPQVRNWASIVTPTIQYVEWFDDAGTTLTFREFYDLVNDPWQLVNLLGDANQTNDPDVTALSARLQAYRTCAGLACPQPISTVDDDEAPSTPGTPTATSTVPGQVALSWAASTDNISTTISYHVYRDGSTLPGTVFSSAATVTFNDSGLTGGNTHVYTVQASDQAGNFSEVSPDSNAVTVMETPPPPPSLFADDFSAGFGTWTTVSNITSDAGTARAVATNTAAYLDKTLSASFNDVCAAASFNVASIGAGQTFVLIRLRGTGTTPIGRVFINGARGLRVRNDLTLSQASGGTLATGYHRVQLCGVVGAGSYLRLSVDGVVRATYVTNIGTAPIAGVQIFDNANKTFTANADDVLVDRVV